MLLIAMLLVLKVLWLSSYTHHSSIGIDHDSKNESGVLHYYHRINWTGHGSIWIGYGSTQRAYKEGQKLERFDPASALLKPVKPLPELVSRWNRFGFWYINSAKPSPTFWIGIPSWLPVLALLLLILAINRRKSGVGG